jgi:FMN phosphatase YigB (HAD superfamily)
MNKYSTVILDLFDTIVNFNFSHLPTIELRGLRSRTTSKEVYEVFARYYPEIEFAEFYDPFIESYHQFQEMKLKEFKEFPNRERFKLMLSKMDLREIKNRDELIDEMVLAHMNGLASCVELPEQNKKTLEYLKTKGYRLAIISNFDYAPTAYMLLERYNIKNLFEEIVISEEVGWRKPKKIIFETVINKLKIEPEDALFVGDNFQADVVGSKALGMDAAWINRKNRPVNNLKPTPDYIINNLPELKNFI